MIENKIIYLPRADINPIYFEGRFIDKDRKVLKNLYKKDGMLHPIKKAKMAIDVFQKHKKFTYFDSWHLNDYECFAMWKIFGKTKNSIAIKTRIHKLKKVYNNKKESDCYLVKVEYYRPNEGLKVYNNLLLFIRKPISFIYEKEIRGIIQWKHRYASEHFKYPSHERIPILNFNDLADEIVLNPYSSDRFINEINKLFIKNGIKNVKISNSIYRNNS